MLRSQVGSVLAAFRTGLERWAVLTPAAAQLFRIFSAHEDTAAGPPTTIGSLAASGAGVESSTHAKTPKLPDMSYREQFLLLAIVQKFLSIPPASAALLRVARWGQVRKEVEGWIAHGLRRNTLWADLSTRYMEDAVQLDLIPLRQALQDASGQRFLPRFMTTLRVARTLRTVLQPGVVLPRSQLGAEIEQLRQLQAEDNALNLASSRAAELLGPLWQGSGTDWDAVSGVCARVDEVRELAQRVAGDGLARVASMRCQWPEFIEECEDPDARARHQLREFMVVGNSVSEAGQSIASMLSLAPTALSGDGRSPGWFARVLDQVCEWESHLDDLRDWCPWARSRAEALAAGLGSVITAYESGRLGHNQVEPAFERGVYAAWIGSQIAGDPALSSFSRGLFEDRIEQFREMDDAVAQLSRQEMYARLSGRVPQSLGDVSQNSEMGILQKEILKQRCHLPMRALFQKIPNVLSLLKPCLLMSPISVAQYLDPAHPPFDLVIFDEASQIPTCDAVGAMARGKEAIIVGDPKQLPPTDFFSSTSGDEDEDPSGMQDLESILDDCLSLRMPELKLRWHYRSQHESLIAFSNHRYYENGLFTFPSPDDLTTAVRWHPVEGTYDRGKSRQNLTEARAVVAEILRRADDPELRKRSIGVVTFSQAQQKLVEDLLDEALSERPDLDACLREQALEPVFIKNLESVQGDERDVILFSIGYGPDAQGRVSMNFGPLNRIGGERRLNVAASRARCEMHVFSSLRPDHLDPSRTTAEGVAGLKAFLEYAQHGKKSLAAQVTARSDAECESIFEEQVCAALRKRGHKVDLQVGCSGYRIDMAVVDPERPGRYLLGVECDGATYHRAQTARDRDKLRQVILQKLGWRIHRTWSTDWWVNPKRELERIEMAIAAALQASSAEAVNPPSGIMDKGKGAPEDDVILAMPDAPPAAPVQTAGPIESRITSGPALAFGIAEPLSVAKGTGTIAGDLAAPAASPAPSVYEPCILERVRLSTEAFYLPESTPRIAAQVRRIIDIEGPVSFRLLSRRIVRAWGMSRVGTRIENRIREVSAGQPVSRSGSTQFYWSSDPAKYAKYRIPGDAEELRREMEDIPPQEIGNAAADILRAQVGLPETDLVREVARLFGYARTGPAVEK